MYSVIFYKENNLTEVSSRIIEHTLYNDRNFESWQVIDVPRKDGPRSSSTTTIFQKLHIYYRITISRITTASRAVDRYRLECASFILTYLGLGCSTFLRIDGGRDCVANYTVSHSRSLYLHVHPREKPRRHVSTMEVWAVCSSELRGATLCTILYGVAS